MVREILEAGCSYSQQVSENLFPPSYKYSPHLHTHTLSHTCTHSHMHSYTYTHSILLCTIEPKQSSHIGADPITQILTRTKSHSHNKRSITEKKTTQNTRTRTTEYITQTHTHQHSHSHTYHELHDSETGAPVPNSWVSSEPPDVPCTWRLCDSHAPLRSAGCSPRGSACARR